MICAQCGKPIDADDLFCGWCGAKVHSPEPIESAESIPVAEPKIIAEPTAPVEPQTVEEPVNDAWLETVAEPAPVSEAVAMDESDIAVELNEAVEPEIDIAIEVPEETEVKIEIDKGAILEEYKLPDVEDIVLIFDDPDNYIVDIKDIKEARTESLIDDGLRKSKDALVNVKEEFVLNVHKEEAPVRSFVGVTSDAEDSLRVIDEFFQKDEERKIIQAALNKECEPIWAERYGARIARVAEPVAVSVEEPAAKLAVKPVAKPVPKPVAAPVEEPAVKPAAKPVPKPVSKPVAVSVEEPAAKPAINPTPTPAQQPLGFSAPRRKSKKPAAEAVSALAGAMSAALTKSTITPKTKPTAAVEPAVAQDHNLEATRIVEPMLTTEPTPTVAPVAEPAPAVGQTPTPEPFVTRESNIEPTEELTDTQETVIGHEPILEPIQTVEPTVEPEPIAPIEPTVAPEPIASVEPTVAPEPIAPIEPTVAPEPIAPIEPTVAPEPVTPVEASANDLAAQAEELAAILEAAGLNIAASTTKENAANKYSTSLQSTGTGDAQTTEDNRIVNGGTPVNAPSNATSALDDDPDPIKESLTEGAKILAEIEYNDLEDHPETGSGRKVLKSILLVVLTLMLLLAAAGSIIIAFFSDTPIGRTLKGTLDKVLNPSTAIVLEHSEASDWISRGAGL